MALTSHAVNRPADQSDTEHGVAPSQPDDLEHMRHVWPVKHSSDHSHAPTSSKAGRHDIVLEQRGSSQLSKLDSPAACTLSTELRLSTKVCDYREPPACTEHHNDTDQRNAAPRRDASASRKTRQHTILEMPPEILIEIFKKLDPCAAFIAALSVNRYFYHTARNSQALWEHQILKLPGVPQHPQRLTMDEVFVEFVFKATGELCPGRQRADFYRFNTLSRLDMKISHFAPESSQTKTPMLLAVEEGLPVVTMYTLPPATEPLEPWRRIRLPPDEYDKEEYGMSPKLLKVAFQKGRLGLLYETINQNRSRQLLEDKPMTPPPNPTFSLALTEMKFIRVRDAVLDGCESHSIQPGIGMDPFTFSISDQESWAIGWKSLGSARTKVTHQLRRRGSQFFPIDVKSDPYCPLTAIKFALRGTKLNLFFGGLPIHQKYCSFTPSMTMQITRTPESNLVPKRLIDLIAIDLRVGMPFYSDHDSQEEGFCKHSYLALATSVDGSRAYVLSSTEVIQRIDCRHPSNPEYGRLISDWKLVGRLEGYEPPVSSAGLKTATSKCGRRIAIANWRTLRVWTLHLNEIRENESEFYVRHRRPTAGLASTSRLNLNLNNQPSTTTINPNNHNNANSEDGSDDGAEDHNNNDDEDDDAADDDDGGGDIFENVVESFEVDTHGDVIHDLMWSGPKTLYALTDRGVCRWYFGHDCKGLYEEGLLQEFQ